MNRTIAISIVNKLKNNNYEFNTEELNMLKLVKFICKHENAFKKTIVTTTIASKELKANKVYFDNITNKELAEECNKIVNYLKADNSNKMIIKDDKLILSDANVDTEEKNNLAIITKIRNSICHNQYKLSSDNLIIENNQPCFDLDLKAPVSVVTNDYSNDVKEIINDIAKIINFKDFNKTIRIIEMFLLLSTFDKENLNEFKIKTSPLLYRKSNDNELEQIINIQECIGKYVKENSIETNDYVDEDKKNLSVLNRYLSILNNCINYLNILNECKFDDLRNGVIHFMLHEGSEVINITDTTDHLSKNNSKNGWFLTIDKCDNIIDVLIENKKDNNIKDSLIQMNQILLITVVKSGDFEIRSRTAKELEELTAKVSEMLYGDIYLDKAVSRNIIKERTIEDVINEINNYRDTLINDIRIKKIN